MLTQETVQNIAKKIQTTQLNIRREYVQHLFLSYLYREHNSKELFFKGGTALRIIYGSPRFSEDLDFSTSLRDTQQIESMVLSALREIEREGIQTEIEESKETTGGYLGLARFHLQEHVLDVQLEISKRQNMKNGDLVTVVSDLIPSYTMMRLPQKQLIAEKIRALQMRKKPRDYYDLYFILRAGLLEPKERSALKQIVKTIPAVNINFKQELEEFLPHSHWPIIKDFKKNLLQEIRRNV